MLQTATFFVPFASPTANLATLNLASQEPKSATDTPSGAPSTTPLVGGPSGGPGGPPTPPQAQTGGMDSSMLIFMGLFVFVMLFMSMRRESKAKKEQAAMLASIKKGDRIVTTAGIHATVDRLDDKTVVLLLDTVPVTFERAAIARVVRDDASLATQKRA